jgi:ABC-type sugar transport system permease subunit
MVNFQKSLFKRKQGALKFENGLKVGNSIFAITLILPALLTWVVFWLYVNASGFVLAFQTVKEGVKVFTLQHFEWVFNSLTDASTSSLGVALKNTLSYFALNYFLIQTMNVLFAYFIFKRIKGYKFFRLVMYLPNILPGLMLITFYKEFISYRGPLADMLINFGLVESRFDCQFLANSNTAMPMSMIYSVWMVIGGTYIYSMGAMARIPTECLEAAQLDGITPFKELIYLIIPMISGTLSTLYVLGMAGILNAGGATLYLTQGNYGTQTLSFWIFWSIYTGGSTGTSSALGLCMAGVTIPLMLLLKWFLNKISPEVTY